MTAADFWFFASYPVGLALVALLAALVILSPRRVLAWARRVNHSLFPPRPHNVVSIDEARQRARFTQVLGPADVQRVYRSVQTLRVHDSQKGFGS